MSARKPTNPLYLDALTRFRETHHRDIALLCEYRPEREYSVSTVCVDHSGRPHRRRTIAEVLAEGRHGTSVAKALASQTELIGAMCRAAVAALPPSAVCPEGEARVPLASHPRDCS